MAEHVAIVGGGFSGAMLAVQLLRRGARVSLIERARDPGPGLAFGAAQPEHLLNVRAGNMSAYPDDPTHFARWLELRGEGQAAAFAPRRAFGTYLKEQLAGADAAFPSRLKIVRGDAVDLVSGDDGVAITLADKRQIEAGAAALAIGNLPPPPPGRDLDRLPPGVWIDDPWAADVAMGLEPNDAVLVIGTGLTMIDMVLQLDSRGFRGPIMALSRRGLMPLAHADGAAAEKRTDAPETLSSNLVGEVRARGEAIGWRQAVDELRPFTQGLWRSASPIQRGRFLRHLRPWWDSHRHRIAPEIALRVEAMIERGQLRIAAGKLVAVNAAQPGAAIQWRPRGGEELERAECSRIVNCTGPEADLHRAPEPLLQALLGRGAIRPGPNGLGVDVDDGMRMIGADGLPDPRFYAVGPITRGVLWEIVAVPDIRAQVAAVANQLG